MTRTDTNNTDILLDWLRIDSTTGREKAFLLRMEEHLAARGLRVQRQHVERDRWNVLAEPADGPAHILLSTHVDTVPPFFGPSVEDDGTIRARGACDTKGGLFAMLRAYDVLPEEARAKVGFLLVVGEEVDHIGAIVASRSSYPSLRATILCEPTRNRMALGQKGILSAVVSAQGKAGHSAFPEAGVSAVHRLVSGLHRLIDRPWQQDPFLGPTTFNIGTVSGGLAANIFAPSASAEVLFRVVGSLGELESEVRSALGPELEMQVRASNPPVRLLAWPEHFPTDVVPFNTDAPYLAQAAPVILVGPGDIRTAHSPNEHITVGDLHEGVATYIRIVTGILDGVLDVGAAG